MDQAEPARLPSEGLPPGTAIDPPRLQHWREWRRFGAETLFGLGLTTAGLFERIRPDLSDLVPHQYSLHAIGVGMALLMGLGNDVLLWLWRSGARIK
jgi:hypothetical protein